jgi:hypothetical protein
MQQAVPQILHDNSITLVDNKPEETDDANKVEDELNSQGRGGRQSHGDGDGDGQVRRKRRRDRQEGEGSSASTRQRR